MKSSTFYWQEGARGILSEEIMSIEQYIETRVNQQIAWYDKKSISMQRKYKCFQVIEIILASLIPLLSAYSKQSGVIAFIVGFFGAAIASIEGIVKLGKYHENWIEYRSTCELLRHEKWIFETRCSPYNSKEESHENIFIRNVESLISSESWKWKSNNITPVKVQSKTGS